MAKDPVCGMCIDEKVSFKLIHKGQSYFFCSSHCLEKFAFEHNIKIPEMRYNIFSSASLPWYTNKTVMVIEVLLSVVLISYVIPSLVPFREVLIMYFESIWWAILLGIFLGGVMDYYVPRRYISYFLARPEKRTIFYSVILGFFMSVCSHGILALSIELYRKGASTPAVVSFLLASPWANFTFTVMLIGFFGMKAFFIIISALIIAIVTGFIFQFLERKGFVEKNERTLQLEDKFSIKEDVKRRFREYKFSFSTLKRDLKGIYRGMSALTNMVLWWILIGMGLAALAGAYIPSNIFNEYMGPTLMGILVTLVVATVIEVCSESSAPLAFELFRQTGAFGNSFVFLMAGVVTDYTEIGLLWHNIGRKTALWLPVVTVPQVIVLGVLANRIF